MRILPEENNRARGEVFGDQADHRALLSPPPSKKKKKKKRIGAQLATTWATQFQSEITGNTYLGYQTQVPLG